MKSIEQIPVGPYCYTTSVTGKHLVCPYWVHRKNVDNKKVNNQNCGYCLYLEKGDLEFNAEEIFELCSVNDDYKMIESHFTANDIGLPLSLLWDMCKMCNVNDDWVDDEEKECDNDIRI